jgi:hypothetical protein
MVNAREVFADAIATCLRKSKRQAGRESRRGASSVTGTAALQPRARRVDCAGSPALCERSQDPNTAECGSQRPRPDTLARWNSATRRDPVRHRRTQRRREDDLAREYLPKDAGIIARQR